MGTRRTLLDYCEALDAAAIHRLLALGVPLTEVNERDINGQTPLHYLCACPPPPPTSTPRNEDMRVACITQLLNAGADVNAIDDHFSQTPLMLASGMTLSGGAGMPMPKVVAALIAAGADLQYNRWRVLYAANSAVSSAAECSCYYSGHDAYRRKATVVIKMLLAAGADVRGHLLHNLSLRRCNVTHSVYTDSRNYFPDASVMAILLRAGATLTDHPKAQMHPFLRKVLEAGGYENYQKNCINSLAATLAPKFSWLPADVIPKIVVFAFNPGLY